MEVTIINRKHSGVAIIDEEYSDLFYEHKWCLSHNYLTNCQKGKINMRYHRYIMMDEIKEFARENNIDDLWYIKIDHINRNTLDNRKSNLRCVRHNDNLCNTGLRSDNTSGEKGITITKSNTYHVCVNYRKNRYRKTLSTLKEAKKWREDKLKELNYFEYKK